MLDLRRFINPSNLNYSFMKKHLFLLVTVVYLTACTQEDYLVKDNLTDSNESFTRVELSEALEIANHFLDGIEGEVTTRSHQREIKDINYLITGKSTRGNDSDAVYYLVNYTEGGFALLGGDRSGMYYDFFHY